MVLKLFVTCEHHLSAPVDCPVPYDCPYVRPGRLPCALRLHMSAPVDCPAPTARVRSGSIAVRLHVSAPVGRHRTQGDTLSSFDCPSVRPGRLQNLTEACRTFAKVPDQLETTEVVLKSSFFVTCEHSFWTHASTRSFS